MKEGTTDATAIKATENSTTIELAAMWGDIKRRSCNEVNRQQFGHSTRQGISRAVATLWFGYTVLMDHSLYP